MSLQLESAWLHPVESPELAPNEAHVWCVSLNQTIDLVRDLEATLADDELLKANRFRFELDRHHFIVGRGILRSILSRYLGQEPRQLSFSYNPHGKPALAARHGQRTLNFNLSHSHELALYAFTWDAAVGIDVEHIRSVNDLEALAQRFFSAHENQALSTVPAGSRQAAFFNCWTRKEAIIKVIGKGLSLPLDQFDVSLVPGEPPKLLAFREEEPDASRLTLSALPVGPDYVAALAVDHLDLQLKYWQY